MFSELLFNNGTFQVYREAGIDCAATAATDVYIMMNDEHVIDAVKLSDLVAALKNLGIPIVQ
jgi:hypothetical protein